MGNARISQAPVEVLLVPDSKARASQQVVEVVIVATSFARISTQVLEVVLGPNNPSVYYHNKPPIIVGGR